MIFTLELNGVKTKHDIPTDWDQVKFKDFLLLNDRKELTALSVFTGMAPETLKKVRCHNLAGQLSFVKTNPNVFKFPKNILSYEVRQDLGFEPYGRYTDLQEIVEKQQEPLELLKQYPLMCAIYCIQGEYDFTLAEEKQDEFLNAPCTEVLAVGNFLLLRLGGLRTTTAKTSQFLHILPKRLRLAFQLWRARLAFTARYYILKKKLHLTEKS